jgi:hypothetical protein
MLTNRSFVFRIAGWLTVLAISMVGRSLVVTAPVSIAEAAVWIAIVGLPALVYLVLDRSVDSGSTARLMYDVERSPVSAKAAADRRRFNGC